LHQSPFKLLARMKRLRGTPLNIFGYTAERRMERGLICEYESTVHELIAKLTPINHSHACQIARIPEQIRGFGHVKEGNARSARDARSMLLKLFRESK
jgi:indolepyruvate ferredoxin oxidoreductase